ncbi:hypothetical protein [Sphingobium yanoikuyae]|nr:hypothetical protein [Sphingobium yanoikuyae]
MGLPDIEPVPGVHLAQDAFARGAKLDVGSAAGAIGIVIQRLAIGVISFDPETPALMLFPHRDQFGGVAGRQGDRAATSGIRVGLSRFDVNLAAGHPPGKAQVFKRIAEDMIRLHPQEGYRHGATRHLRER